MKSKQPARITVDLVRPELLMQLREKYPERGELSRLIRRLLRFSLSQPQKLKELLET